jgi:hypothetical protein
VARQRRFNPRQFVKAAVIFACGVFLLVHSGVFARSPRRSWRFPEETRQAVENWIGWGLMAAGVWFYQQRGLTDDEGDGQ